jgi:hypothetical protein
LLNELGFNRDWIEKCLAHEEGRSSRGVYNKAEYEHQRRHMLQEWADMIDSWIDGRQRTPALYPPRQNRAADGAPSAPEDSQNLRATAEYMRANPGVTTFGE